MTIHTHHRVRTGIAVLTAAAAAVTVAPGAQAGDTDGTREAQAAVSPSGQLVSRADVDGDGARDRVFLDNGSTTGRVTVVLATGHWVSTRHALELVVSGGEFTGAAHVDGEPGHELVVPTSIGAHTVRSRVITYRDGELVTLRDPSARYRWVTDGSVWSSYGYRRSLTATGEVKMTSYGAVSQDGGQSFDQTVTSARWTENGWARLGRVHRTVDSVTAHEYGGWHVPHLEPGTL